jgi:hypothetical protein
MNNIHAKAQKISGTMALKQGLFRSPFWVKNEPFMFVAVFYNRSLLLFSNNFKSDFSL